MLKSGIPISVAAIAKPLFFLLKLGKAQFLNAIARSYANKNLSFSF